MAEGRRVTANIERVANLFIAKTVWATLLAIAAGAALLPFPCVSDLSTLCGRGLRVRCEPVFAGCRRAGH